MNLSIRKSSIVCFGIVFFSVVLLRSEHSAASEQAALGVQLNSSQGTETKIMPDRGKAFGRARPDSQSADKHPTDRSVADNCKLLSHSGIGTQTGRQHNGSFI